MGCIDINIYVIYISAAWRCPALFAKIKITENGHPFAGAAGRHRGGGAAVVAEYIPPRACSTTEYVVYSAYEGTCLRARQGAIVEAELPDGRRLHVAVEEVIHPGFVKAGSYYLLLLFNHFL